MKAVNLVPKDYRRGRLAGRRGEVFSYALIGGLAVILLAVVAVVLTSNKISDNKAEVAKLSQQRDEAQAEADALAPYANFASLAQARTATVSSLAQSRFDWERVVRELADVLPSDVWLTQLAGTVVPDVTLDGAPSLASRASVTGPALEIVGCASNQESVAKFVAALEDIDGVTRVGLQSSVKPDSADSSGGDPGGASGECRTRAFIPKFEIVAAFDAAPVPAGATTAAGTAPATPAPATPTTPDSSGVGQAQQQQAADQQSVQQAKDKSQKATSYIPGK
jgi:Tfp pilus assembly protein PilN